MGAAENVQITGEHHLVGRLRYVLMGQPQWPAAAIEGFEYPAQRGLHGVAQLQRSGNFAGHFAVHHGERRRFVHGVHVGGAQRTVQHGAAAVHIVAQQVGKPLGIGRAARPAQQGYLLHHLHLFGVSLSRLRQLPGQASHA
ncbi:hypothetical protein D9M68_792220 [compost metagenome]